MTSAERTNASRAACVSATSLARSSTSLIVTTREPSSRVTPAVTIAGKRSPFLRQRMTSNSPWPSRDHASLKPADRLERLRRPVGQRRRSADELAAP